MGTFGKWLVDLLPTVIFTFVVAAALHLAYLLKWNRRQAAVSDSVGSQQAECTQTQSTYPPGLHPALAASMPAHGSESAGDSLPASKYEAPGSKSTGSAPVMMDSATSLAHSSSKPAGQISLTHMGSWPTDAVSAFLQDAKQDRLQESGAKTVATPALGSAIAAGAALVGSSQTSSQPLFGQQASSSKTAPARTSREALEQMSSPAAVNAGLVQAAQAGFPPLPRLCSAPALPVPSSTQLSFAADPRSMSDVEVPKVAPPSDDVLRAAAAAQQRPASTSGGRAKATAAVASQATVAASATKDKARSQPATASLDLGSIQRQLQSRTAAVQPPEPERQSYSRATTAPATPLAAVQPAAGSPAPTSAVGLMQPRPTAVQRGAAGQLVAVGRSARPSALYTSPMQHVTVSIKVQVPFEPSAAHALQEYVSRHVNSTAAAQSPPQHTIMHMVSIPGCIQLLMSLAQWRHEDEEQIPPSAAAAAVALPTSQLEQQHMAFAPQTQLGVLGLGEPLGEAAGRLSEYQHGMSSTSAFSSQQRAVSGAVGAEADTAVTSLAPAPEWLVQAISQAVEQFLRNHQAEASTNQEVQATPAPHGSSGAAALLNINGQKFQLQPNAADPAARWQLQYIGDETSSDAATGAANSEAAPPTPLAAAIASIFGQPAGAVAAGFACESISGVSNVTAAESQQGLLPLPIDLGDATSASVIAQTATSEEPPSALHTAELLSLTAEMPAFFDAHALVRQALSQQPQDMHSVPPGYLAAAAAALQEASKVGTVRALASSAAPVVSGPEAAPVMATDVVKMDAPTVLSGVWVWPLYLPTSSDESSNGTACWMPVPVPLTPKAGAAQSSQQLAATQQPPIVAVHGLEGSLCRLVVAGGPGEVLADCPCSVQDGIARIQPEPSSVVARRTLFCLTPHQAAETATGSNISVTGPSSEQQLPPRTIFADRLLFGLPILYLPPAVVRELNETARAILKQQAEKQLVEQQQNIAPDSGPDYVYLYISETEGGASSVQPPADPLRVSIEHSKHLGSFDTVRPRSFADTVHQQHRQRRGRPSTMVSSSVSSMSSMMRNSLHRQQQQQHEPREPAADQTQGGSSRACFEDDEQHLVYLRGRLFAGEDVQQLYTELLADLGLLIDLAATGATAGAEAAVRRIDNSCSSINGSSGSGLPNVNQQAAASVGQQLLSWAAGERAWNICQLVLSLLHTIGVVLHMHGVAVVPENFATAAAVQLLLDPDGVVDSTSASSESVPFRQQNVVSEATPVSPITPSAIASGATVSGSSFKSVMQEGAEPSKQTNPLLRTSSSEPHRMQMQQQQVQGDFCASVSAPLPALQWFDSARSVAGAVLQSMSGAGAAISGVPAVTGAAGSSAVGEGSAATAGASVKASIARPSGEASSSSGLTVSADVGGEQHEMKAGHGGRLKLRLKDSASEMVSRLLRRSKSHHRPSSFNHRGPA